MADLQYKVRLETGHKAKSDQITPDGFLGMGDTACTYSRGWALKKANAFGGRIELVELSKVFTTVFMTQIPEMALLDGVEKLLVGREKFEHGNIYDGDVFADIMNEIREGFLKVDTKTLIQLKDLAVMIRTEYVQVTKG